MYPAFEGASEIFIMTPIYSHEPTLLIGGAERKLTMCPDCEAEIKVPEGTTPGEIVSCPDCGLELEVKAINGDRVDLKEISIEKEDWGE
jgi:alpha-aminoadipate carrier protein LysW